MKVLVRVRFPLLAFVQAGELEKFNEVPLPGCRINDNFHSRIQDAFDTFYR